MLKPIHLFGGKSMYSQQERLSYPLRPTLLTLFCLILTGCAGSEHSREEPVTPAATFELLKGPAAQPITSVKRLPVISDSTRVQLNYIKADIRTVVEHIASDVLAMPIMIDPVVGGKMTLRTSGKVPASEVPRLLDEALAKHGYGLAAVDQRVRVARLTDLAAGRRDFQTIHLRHADPTNVIDVIRPYVDTRVHLAPLRGQRGIVIDGPSEGVRAARELITSLATDGMPNKAVLLLVVPINPRR
ncbi:hypothetical protein [Bradyrhizobium sp. CB3481]|uniref:hypothetical protein n=1 Tax=Bradyrhizobium sp. CB3481 TaxID=3039158 RepID=UPI0024B1462E|nr:hypothetical protein [Bradyrhizobium sp. CB3481]WFU20786.1 hypothetical protein QA643_28315 [Bradyrhizobium sp. CB3481]